MNRAVLLVCTQNLLIAVSLSGGRILLTLYALSIGATAAEVGVVVSLLFVAPALFSWPVGMLADRLGPHWIMGAGAAVNTLAMLAPFFSPSLSALCIAALGTGMGVGLSNVLGQSLIGTLSSPQTRTQNYGNYTVFGGIGNFVGPMAIGFAIDHAGFANSSLLLAGLAAVSAALVLAGGGILPRRAGRVKQGGGRFDTLTDPGLRRVLFLSVVAQTGLDAYLSFMPVYAHNAGLSASVTGVALSVTAIAVIGVRIGMSRIVKSLGEEKVMLGGFLSGATAFFALPFFQAPEALMVISLVFGLFMGLTQPIILLILFNASPPGRGGEVLGLRLSINNATRIVSPVVFGAMARVLGLAPLFIFSGALLCLGGWLSRGRAKEASPK